MKNILIIEDDPSIAAVERDFLEINGFSAAIAADGETGLKEALSGEYDLILLDLQLPGMDGYEICRRVRKSLDIPILMVSARIEEIDKVRGLGLGADDYISKPFSPTELVARVKANLAQYERPRMRAARTALSEEIKIDNLRINVQARRVYVDGKEIEYTNKEYELLLFLMSNPEVVFSKETLYDRIWGEDVHGDLKTVAVHINRLREKVEKDPANPAHIETVWGAGYRFKI
ncbi:response regulator transcription factor [Breznakiella homolactica]|uniref:Phosphate regulon transcriptional regulatory protein PhoB n=1 Tax=Breznakiella homolactica TaxID=2798577 RepID=A0A7T7XP24_9SPIR|nr:response regulator transcription factor [Breznakiella homolactica]QQO09871.1 response regulator transcription factor [Breznakiella homolactica]